MKQTTFSAFIGPIITLLPAVFVASNGGLGFLGFCVITTFSLILCYLFKMKGLFASTALLLLSFYFLDLQFVWAFGVFISMFSGLIVTTIAWSISPVEENDPTQSMQSILVQTKQNLQEALMEKNALRQKLSAFQNMKMPDQSGLKKELEEKSKMLFDIKQELFSVKSKLETLQSDSQKGNGALEKKLQEKEKILELYKKQESELLSLLKKESQTTTE